ncbi:hypothetical protein HF072_07365 [Bacillus sp. RO3]|nr:hypothetical protein [Bacillus sp. RO3]
MSSARYKRKDLRFSLLEALYDHYFENGGTALKLIKEDLVNDPEKDLAYNYLEKKGLIVVERQGQSNFYLKPSVHGIDLVEDATT